MVRRVPAILLWGVVLVVLWVAVLWGLTYPAWASHASAVITASSSGFDVEFVGRVDGHNGEASDTCRFQSEGGYDSGFGPCTATWAHTYAAAGEKWAGVTVRDALGQAYFSYQRAFTVASLASAAEVKVVNVPQVRITPTPVPVKIRGVYCPSPPPDTDPAAECVPASGGFDDQDSDNLRSVQVDARGSRYAMTFSLGLLLFAAGGLVVMAIPKIR